MLTEFNYFFMVFIKSAISVLERALQIKLLLLNKNDDKTYRLSIYFRNDIFIVIL